MADERFVLNRYSMIMETGMIMLYESGMDQRFNRTVDEFVVREMKRHATIENYRLEMRVTGEQWNDSEGKTYRTVTWDAVFVGG